MQTGIILLPVYYSFESNGLLGDMISMMVQRLALLTHSSRVYSLILSLGQCLCGISYVLLMSVWISSRFLSPVPKCIDHPTFVLGLNVYVKVCMVHCKGELIQKAYSFLIIMIIMTISNFV